MCKTDEEICEVERSVLGSFPPLWKNTHLCFVFLRERKKYIYRKAATTAKKKKSQGKRKKKGNNKEGRLEREKKRD